MKGALLLTGLALALLLLAGRLAPAPAPDAARWAMRLAVVVDGVTYASTGQRHGGIQADAVPDGAVTASVESWEWPAKDGESNFGAGYDYLRGEPGKLYVNFDGNWIVFEKWEEAESRAGG